ncbi:hypothetical protein KM92DES2_10347 [uncultured Desulfovibrio sp.]|uniref:Uncharacterized protein n=1 Tax=uncultured Desulfovibrio sp. TaxID=167968 RepID=A0A212J0P1_9BACT|nr:hypothetical protein KM92DES2_10347 [uncultured Desulfovibrio sp.]
MGCRDGRACFEILCESFCIIYTIFHNSCKKPLIISYYRIFFTLHPHVATLVATRTRILRHL